MSELVYETSFHNFDTASYKELQSLALKWKSSNSVELLNELKVAGITLLSHGLDMEIPRLSIKNIHYKGKNLGGLDLEGSLHVDEDKNLAAKMLFLPLFIFKNIDFKVKMRVSKKIYYQFLQELFYISVIPATHTSNHQDLLYDISYLNGDLKINGKRIF